VALDAPADAHILFDEIERLWPGMVFGLGNIDCFRLPPPGRDRYRGVRIGLTAVKGLASRRTGAKGVAVNRISKALHSSARVLCERRSWIARRGEISAASTTHSLHGRDESVVRSRPGFPGCPGDLEIIPVVSRCPLRLSVIHAPRALAGGAIAQIAARRFFEGLAVGPAQIDAITYAAPTPMLLGRASARLM